MTRQEQIHSQGFNMFSNMPTEYGKIKVNTKTLDDAIQFAKVSTSHSLSGCLQEELA